MYTEKELYHAAIIAYYIFDNELAENMKVGNRYTIKNAFINYSEAIYKKSEKLDSLERLATQKFYDSIKSADYAYANWTILRVDDFNDENGCYAITLLPPNSDTAIIAFRGSENGSASIFINDWVVADFGLFAGEVTAQQTSALDIVENILEDERLKNYNFVLTGHSLDSLYLYNQHKIW